MIKKVLLFYLHEKVSLIFLIFLLILIVFYTFHLFTMLRVRGHPWRSGTKCDCKPDWLWVRSPLEEMKYLLKFIFALVPRLSAALSSATQHAMPPEFGRKWGTECLNTRFPLPTLLCVGYSVKLIFFFRLRY